jgi:hypothetical protein
VSLYRIFRLAAHFVPPSTPILYFSIPGVDEFTENQFNISLRRELRARGFCNSEGFFDDAPFEESARAKVRFDQFRSIVMDTLEKMGHRFPTYAARFQYEHKTLSLESLKGLYGSLVKTSSDLLGFDGIDAMHLFYKCLQPHQYSLNQIVLDEVKEAVLGCIEIAQRAKDINDSDISDSKKHDEWYALAGEIVQWLITHNKLLLIQIGTPIKTGEKSSNHAIYVAARFKPGTNDIQVIITNGGDKVSLFHHLSKQCHPKDREEYHYAAFEPFKPDQEHLAALKHYLYLCVSIEYRKSVTDDVMDTNEAGEVIGQNPYTFTALLRNVYLRTCKQGEKEYFEGYRAQKIVIFRRQDLSECFLVQFARNCTIHNLMKALQVLFNMDQIEYGYLTDTLVLGLDKLISVYKPELELQTSTQSEHHLLKKSGALPTPIGSCRNGNFWESTSPIPKVEELSDDPTPGQDEKTINTAPKNS